jgi:hypothetical protein
VEWPMPELNGENITRIRADVEKSGIRNNLLKDELVDHVCCQVEAEMRKGMSFDEAYQEISANYTKKEISKTERNISLFLNYRSIITSGLLYISIGAFVVSWITHITRPDWIGLIAFLLISFVF